MQLVKCLVNEISIRFGEFGQRLGRGGTVDLDRKVGKLPARGSTPARDVTIGDLLRGREDCFEPADATAKPAAFQPATALDVDDDRTTDDDQQ